MAKKPVECILSQRRILARAFARYAWEQRSLEHRRLRGVPLPTWGELSHEEAEEWIDAANEELDKLLDGGSIAPFTLDREAS